MFTEYMLHCNPPTVKIGAKDEWFYPALKFVYLSNNVGNISLLLRDRFILFVLEKQPG